MPADAVFHQAAALCLTRPDEDLVARLPLLREAAPQLREFTDHAAVTPLGELAAHYERVFGGGDRHRLCLAWGREGDGAALGRFRELYRAHGLELGERERPDLLPAVLEFTARTGDPAPLAEHHEALNRLRAHLTDLDTPYACVLTAICATLPPRGERDHP
ncbi:molecular chaperone TorD family protein [Streptomyces sp. NPDC026672]|uniref:nitrate reductase molybdenum cofactor assembly chaperone n=1 Tax=unclassified Streptomyces TaxID=2593676 RepID=UPI0033D203A0